MAVAAFHLSENGRAVKQLNIYVEKGHPSEEVHMDECEVLSLVLPILTRFAKLSRSDVLFLSFTLQ